MKKIKSMRAAAGIVVAALLTTCLIGGTFAKYTSGSGFTDTARVAFWGFEGEGTCEMNLFQTAYDNVLSADDDKVIAPGTSGSDTFCFNFVSDTLTAPEVGYTFQISVDEDCDDAIKANPNIQFALDENGYGTWDEMIADILALSGSASGVQQYQAGELPGEFQPGIGEHTVSWRWLFTDSSDPDAQDEMDTAMGNKLTADSCSLTISIVATQID